MIVIAQAYTDGGLLSVTPEQNKKILNFTTKMKMLKALYLSEEPRGNQPSDCVSEPDSLARLETSGEEYLSLFFTIINP